MRFSEYLKPNFMLNSTRTETKMLRPQGKKKPMIASKIENWDKMVIGT